GDLVDGLPQLLHSPHRIFALLGLIVGARRYLLDGGGDLAGGADGLLHDAVDLAAAAGQSVAGFTNLQQKAPVVGQHAVEGLGHLAHLVGGGHFQVRQGKVAGGQPAESVADGRYRPGDGPGQDQGPDDGHQQAAQGYAPVDEVGAPDGGIGLLPHQDGSGGGVV